VGSRWPAFPVAAAVPAMTTTRLAVLLLLMATPVRRIAQGQVYG
jgi:hypothetical protein